MKIFTRLVFIMLTAILLAACGPEDMLRPSNRIGQMWVNRYGHGNAPWIWNYCDYRAAEEPGVQTMDCVVPWVDELKIGPGIRAKDETQRDALWEARTWEMYIDGYAVDLPAFNILDYDAEVDGATQEYRMWRIRLRNIPAGQHTLHYVMHVNREIQDDPASQSPGTYELIVNFTFEEK